MTEAVRQAVLVTRPEPGATETAERLDALGFDPVLAPSIRIRALQANLPPPARIVAVLITSGQAIAAIPDTYRSVRVFTVGDTTAARARQAGFIDIVSAAGDAKDLVAVVRGAVAPAATLLLVTGQGLGQSLAVALRAAGFAVVRRSVYASLPVRRLPASALCALRSGRLRAAMFFSADTAMRFTSIIERAALHDTVVKTDAVAISRPAAMALQRLPWRRILVAARPDQDAMLALLR